MANIKTFIEKEVEKGNTFLTKSGEFVSPDKIEKTLRKSYVAGLKDGSINFEKSFIEYFQDELEVTYIPVSALEKGLTAFINYDVDPVPMNEPAENIAN